MTLGDVRRQILNLGFETEASYEEQESILTDAVNRAMREITNTFPLIGEYRIAQNPPKNLLPPSLDGANHWHYDGSTPVRFSADSGRALYFECSGTGTLTLTDGGGERVIELAATREPTADHERADHERADRERADRAITATREFTHYREFVSGRVSLEFSGEFAYDINNLAVYAELYSDRIGDIPPYRRYVRYDFRELTKIAGNPAAVQPERDVYTFIDFLDKVREDGTQDGGSYRDIKDFKIEKRHVLVLDGRENAEYTVFYRRNFVPVTAETPESFEIELDYDREHLLPLLAAWYVWADDEPTKAAKWRNDYEDFAARLLATAKPSAADEPFMNDLGW